MAGPSVEGVRPDNSAPYPRHAGGRDRPCQRSRPVGGESGDRQQGRGRRRDEGLIAGVGLSNVSLGQLRHAAEATDIVCVQNLFHLAERSAAPVLQECLSRGIAFVPFCPLGWPRGCTASLAHLRDNLAAENVTLDREARAALDRVRSPSAPPIW